MRAYSGVNIMALSDTVFPLEFMEGRTQVMLVTPELLSKAWPHMERLLRMAPTDWKARFSVEDVHARVADEQMQAWLINDAEGFIGLLLTQIVYYPKMRELHLMLLVGVHMSWWLTHLTEVERWARAHGAEASFAIGRSGWERALAPYGYSEKAVMVRKDLRGQELEDV